MSETSSAFTLTATLFLEKISKRCCYTQSHVTYSPTKDLTGFRIMGVCELPPVSIIEVMLS